MKTHWIMFKEIVATDPTYQMNNKGWLETLLGWIPFLSNGSDDDFFYNINDLNFTLDEIRDGILRGNKKSTTFKLYTNKNPKFNLVQVFYLCLIVQVYLLFFREKIPDFFV